MHFWVGGYAEQLHGAFMQCYLPVFAGFYWEPLPGKAVWKILAKSKFGELTSVEKYINHISSNSEVKNLTNIPASLYNKWYCCYFPVLTFYFANF
jgi:hypothetical protein